ncbi:MAG: NAD(P)-dependent oxidoreductase [Gemmataceae bacterium]|nr:NAD(P)-dependent oxidoreductase [Gemmataceae bacterium]
MRAGERMALEVLQSRFADVPAPFSADEALIEAARCLYCFDAPCMRACPTHIDVPKFIRQILHKNEVGAAKTILDANIFGGSCARACPTEVLCEGACVDNTLLGHTVEIGRLQRYATDVARARGIKFYTPGLPTGKRVAVVGSGPAGLTCAHELRKLGHDVVVFEARDVPGGLNTLGLAAYKVSTEFALSEVELIRQVGVDIRLNQRISAEALRKLLGEFDAVFLAVGLGRTKPLGLPGEELPGIWEALDFIFQTHTRPLTECEIAPRVLVLGAGNTAIDVATAAVRLGAEEVTIAYRRGEQAVPAFAYEYGLARADGVRFVWYAQPVRFEKRGNAVAVEFARTSAGDPAARTGRLDVLQGQNFTVEADMVVKALGQEPLLELLRAIPGLTLDGDKVKVDRATGATSVARLFAGGDCVRGGGEVVDAVQDGKLAARGIHRQLCPG